MVRAILTRFGLLIGPSLIVLFCVQVAVAQDAGAALAGTVTSAAESAMEGVLVSAKRADSNMMVTVVTDSEGNFAFPRDRLREGPHTITVRAVGYVLPAPERVVEIRADSPVRYDLRLESANILEKALQLSTVEWLMSYPLPEETKFETLRDCTRCHTLQRPSMSTYTEAQLPHVLQRMIYSSGSTPLSYQIPEDRVADWGRRDGVMHSPTPLHYRQAEAVAAINLSRGTWQYPLQTLPRPTGDDTRVIYTTYDLPRPLAKPHDTRIGPDGWIYYNDFNDAIIGKLNPKTGETKEYRYDYSHLMEEGGLTEYTEVGSRTMTHDGNGIFYINTQEAEVVVEFDSRAETFDYYLGSRGIVQAQSRHVDGWAWQNRGGPGGTQLRRAKFLGNGEWVTEAVSADGGTLSSYDVAVDTRNNVWGGNRGVPHMFRVDAKTLEATFYPIPEEPRGVGGLGTGMRRGLADSQDRMWFGGFDGGFVGMVDPRLPRGQEVKLWVVPMPWFQPYSADNDDAGYTWTASISADHAARLNESTGEWNLYLLPREANIRDINVQRSAGGLSSVWIGMNHNAAIVHVEPLVP